MTSLFKKYGGAQNLKDIIDALYIKILDDDHLAPFFQDTDIEKLKDQQRSFFTFALGGSNSPPKVPLKKVHKNLPIKELHFNIFIEHLEEVLSEAQMEDEDIETIVNIINSTKGDIVGNLTA